jgi:uncharacterized protein with GYD domain
MAHYMHQIAFTPEAWAKMVNNPQSREAAMRPMFEKLGGKLLSYWFCFGDYDAVLITELPGNVSAAAACMASAQAGTLKALKTTPLVSVEESMEAMRKAGSAGFRPPS